MFTSRTRLLAAGTSTSSSLRAITPTELSDPEFVDWVALAEQEAASPGSALDLLEMNLQIDLRALLPAIRVPTVVLQVARRDSALSWSAGPRNTAGLF